MGIVKTRRCDVSQTSLNIKSYEITLTEVQRVDNGPGEEESIEPVEVLISRVIDLSPRALKRLKGFIDRGTTPLQGISRRQPPKDEHTTKQKGG